ncbi:MAG: class I SAM-dependent methyltransferase [Chlorobi bacterium]|nr:class I SAM-dependent methyltransferase [Chlorobiota bacterium]
MNPVTIVESAAELEPHQRYYWRYQFLVGEHVLVPMLRRRGAFAPGMRVFEFGCGEAGVLGAFVRAGASRGVGADISAYRIEVGRRIADVCGLPLQLETRDLLGEPLPPDWCGAFDLILVRDVIEHLDDTAAALDVVRRLLVTGGHALVTFPPYYSPFGGHQHLLQTRLGMVPWVHLLPRPVFEIVVSGSDRPADREEVRRLRSIRLTVEKFERAAASAGLEIVAADLYLLRPVFRFKFGLPTIALPSVLRRTPLANVVALEASYVLRSRGQP